MISLNINGEAHNVDADPGMPLLWVLRDTVGLTGTKFGCGAALCGACTVHVDGKPIRSCSTPVSLVAGKKITTIEAMSATPVGQKVQAAWAALDVPQCGYCQSGQIMSAAALLAAKPDPTDADIDDAMAGNICRCGTYPRIRAAIHGGGHRESDHGPLTDPSPRVPEGQRRRGRPSSASRCPTLLKPRRSDGDPMPNAWVKIGRDNNITIISARSEIESLHRVPTLVAEERRSTCEDQSRDRSAAEPYINSMLGGQITGGSTSVAEGYDKLRIAGAGARCSWSRRAEWGSTRRPAARRTARSGPGGKAARTAGWPEPPRSFRCPRT
jgi:aerobic-type carbon monoxide dehydrogenase small subunit (CoxS/CutS family)